MNGYIQQEPCGCYAVYVEGTKISTHKEFADAEAALIHAYLLFKTREKGPKQ